jgi:hypothetical protein
MTKEREALKLALEALEDRSSLMKWQEARDAVKEALAQPEQEPVVGTKTWFEDGKVVTQNLTAKDIYKEPEQREPVAYSGNGTAGREADVKPTGFFFQMPIGEVYGWQGTGKGQPMCRFDASEAEMPVGTKLYTTPPQPEPPPECQTEAEKTAFAFGWFKAMEAQRLAQPEQEPVAWKEDDEVQCPVCKDKGFPWPKCGHITYIERTPPQRTWVGLTRAECLQIEKDMMKYYDYQHECKTVCLPEFARAIEAKLKQKNGFAEEKNT